jgi:type IV secretion system protein VirB10
MSEEQGVHQVRGERDANPVSRSLSLQSRASNVLAIGLMSVLGLGSLSWYYANAMLRGDRAKQSAKAASSSRAQGDMPLPTLGRIDAPRPLSPLEPPKPQWGPPDQSLLAAQTLAEIPLAPSPAAPATGAPPSKTPEELAMERELSGLVFASQGGAVNRAERSSAEHGDAMGAKTGNSTDGESTSGAASPTGMGDTEVRSRTALDSVSVDGRREGGDLPGLLRPTATAAVRAENLPAQRLLLPKGAFIDCTLETAIDSALPGMTTCIMATDAFGVDGQVVLLERGTKLIGETRGQVQQGSARIFVLWSEARTPTGVVVPLDSPGADELGRSGLPGQVNRHFWERFGAAMLVSVIDGAVQAAAQSSHGGGGNIVLNPSSSQDVLSEILKSTIGIPPTVVKPNGDRIQVLVARDVDFRSVYELRSTAAGR